MGMMWRSVVFFAIVGLILAESSQSTSQWQANQEYTYELYSKTLTALPDLGGQYVGVVTKARLIVQAKSENQIVGKLIKVTNGNFHDDLPNGFVSEIPEQKLSYHDSPLNNKVFIVNYSNGIIRSVVVDNSMTNDDVNQLKAVLSQMQVDVMGSRVISSRHNQLPENDQKPYGLFKTMEPSITGECETLYEINPLPAHVESYQNQNEQVRSVNLPGGLIEIVKTINYKNCDSRRGYHYGLSGETYLKPNTNQIGGLLSKSTITKVVLSGSLNKGTIKSSTTINRIAVSTALNQKEKAQVYSEITLTLTNKQEIRAQIVSPSQSTDAGNLVYRYSLPSDIHNKIRQSNNENESTGSSSSASVSSEDNRNSERFPSSSSLLSSTLSEEDSNEAFYKPKFSHHYQPRPNMNQAPEQPFNPLTNGRKNVYHLSDTEMITKAKKLIYEIAQNLQNPNEIPKLNTLEKFDTITDFIRIMNQQQIVVLGNELNWHQDNNLDNNLSGQVYRDAVAQAGTGPSVAVATKWITERQIVGNEAASVADTMLSSLSTPTEEIIRVLFEQLVKNDVVQEDRVVYDTVLLSFTDLLRHAYSNRESAYNRYPVQTYGSFQKELAKLVLGEVIPFLAERLDENIGASKSQRTILYIRALGNVAHPKIIGVYEKHIESNKITNAQRTMMTMALDKLTVNFPRFTHNILYKIISNPEQDSKTRSVAVILFMRSDPPVSLLQTMAQSTNDDDSEIVKAVIISAINSAAELTAAEHSKLSANAKAAQPFLNHQNVEHLSSYSKMSDNVDKNSNVVRSKHVSYLTSDQGILSYFEKNNYGAFSVDEVEMQAFISNIEQLWEQFRSINYQFNSFHHSNKEKASNQKFTNDYLVKKLGVTAEEAQEIEGQLLLKILGRKHFYSFDENLVKGLPNYLAEYLESLSTGKSVKYSKLYNRREIVISFPLATGHSFVYEYKTPTFMEAIGEVKVQTIPLIKKSSIFNSLHKTEAISASAKIQLVLSTQQMEKVGFLTAFDSQHYVAGHVHKFQLYIPIEAEFNYDVKNNKFSGKLAPLNNQKDVNFFETSSWPFTARKDAYSLRPLVEAKDVRLIETRPSKGYKKVFGEKTNGLAIVVQTEHQLSTTDLAGIENHIQRQALNNLWKLPTDIESIISQVLDGRHSLTLGSLVSYFQSNVIGVLSTVPWYAPVMDQYMFNVKYDASRSTNRAVTFAVQVNNQAHIKNLKQQSMMTNVFTGTIERKLSIPSVSRVTHNTQRQKQFLENAAFGFQEGSAMVVDASVVFDGENHVEYIATYAQGQNAINNRQRVLIFMSAPTENLNTQQLCATYNSFFPNTLAPVLNNDEIAAFNLEVTVGNECISSISHLQVTSQMSQTKTYKQNYNQNQVGQFFVPNSWDQLSFTARSEGLTQTMNIALNNILSFLRYNGYRNLVQDPNQKGNANNINGIVQFLSNYVNVTIQTPESNDKYLNLPLSSFVQNLLTNYPELSWKQTQHRVRDDDKRVCVVDKSEILTFDNSHVQGQTIGKCWYTLILPAPGTKNMNEQLYNNDLPSVLVRQQANSKKRQLLVMVGQQSEYQQRIILTPTENAFTVEINGHEQQVSQTEAIQIGAASQNNGEPLASVYASGNDEVTISLNGGQMNINFNGERVQIYANQIYRNKIIGLCGRYNNERVDDIATPKNCVLRDPSHFAASWSITDESCDAETIRNQEKAKKAGCSEISSNYGGNLVSLFEAGRLQREDQKYNRNYWQHSGSSHSSEETLRSSNQNSVNDCHLKHQIQYVENHGKTCFSMEMVPACAPGCKPFNKVEQTVEVYCRNSNDSVARMFVQQIRRGANPNLSGKKVTKKLTYRVPQACMAA